MSPANNIPTEIRATREELSRRFPSVIPALLAHPRKGEQAAESVGRKVESFVNPLANGSGAFRVNEE